MTDLAGATRQWPRWRFTGSAAVTILLAALAVGLVGLTMSPLGVQLRDVSQPTWVLIATGSAGVFASLGVLRYGGQGYVASLWVSVPAVPISAAFVSVLTYLQASPVGADVPADPGMSVGLGLSTAVLLWSLLAFPASGMATRQRAQMRVYGELIQRFGILKARVDAERKRMNRLEPGPAAGAERDKALREAESRLTWVEKDLANKANEGPALRWALASGYIGLRRELHRVEEALYAIEDPAELVGDVLHDDLSLEDSGLKNRFTLRRVIRDALPSVSELALEHLLRPVPALPTKATWGGSRATASRDKDEPTLPEAEARQALREVRFAINDYRDDIMDSFARGRNRLIWTFLAVAVKTYVLLALGLVAGITRPMLLSIAALYMVASLVALFNRLRIESSRAPTTDDYGLYLSRLLTGALLSGLAGVAGVYVIAQAPAFLGPLTGTPDAGGVVSEPMALEQVYDLATNKLAILVAAVFGLAPGLLTSRLQQQVDRLERDLQRSEPATRISPADEAAGSSTEDERG